jgi:AraC-like DNA-binding protein
MTLCEYSDIKTGAYFAVKSAAEFRKMADVVHPHQWFTIYVIEKGNSELKIDDYHLFVNKPMGFFITPGQHVYIPESANIEGYAISFNKEFYCIEYHDSDVSCNGLLFVNNFNAVRILLNEQQLAVYTNTAKEMIAELQNTDPLQAEMLKNLLKNLLIRSNRLFRLQNNIGEADDANIDFVRKFSDLVEKNFLEIKQVEPYAQMLGIAPASLAKKLQKYGIESPSRIIKNRIITEAKRLLLYTDKSIKEIATIIGYDDPHYFSRLFKKESGISPGEYKKNFLKS